MLYKENRGCTAEYFHTAEHMLAYKRLQQRKKRLQSRSYDNHF
jgi:hypothetical protein